MKPESRSIQTFEAVFLTLYRLQIHFQVSYTTLKRSTIQSYIKKWYGLDRCLSTISYHLGILRKLKYISVFEQFGTKEDGTHFNIASNRSTAAKGLLFLRDLLVRIPKWLWQLVFKGVKLPRKSFKQSPKVEYKVTESAPRM